MLTDFRLSWRGLSGTYPLAYFAISDEEKCFITVSPGINVSKLFSFSLIMSQNKLGRQRRRKKSLMTLTTGQKKCRLDLWRVQGKLDRF
jgi:hypothetical protein